MNNNLQHLKDNIAIILVGPQMGENIGSVARVMKNFGLKDLRLICPRDGWPNPKAEAMSTSGADIIMAAKLYDDVAGAIFDLNYVYASTARPRASSKKVIYSTELTKECQMKGKIGIMFGRESSGLTNDEVNLAQAIVTINYTEFGSLNLGQAAGLICYELFNSASGRSIIANKASDLASQAEFEFFMNSLDTALVEKGFYSGDYTNTKNSALRAKIRNLFGKIEGLSKSDLNLLHGILK